MIFLCKEAKFYGYLSSFFGLNLFLPLIIVILTSLYLLRWIRTRQCPSPSYFWYVPLQQQSSCMTESTNKSLGLIRIYTELSSNNAIPPSLNLTTLNLLLSKWNQTNLLPSHRESSTTSWRLLSHHFQMKKFLWLVKQYL